jgi:hypothetical protein
MLTANSATIKTTSGTLNFYRHTRPALGPSFFAMQEQPF